MDYKASYRQLVEELQRLGGSLQGVGASYTLEGEALVRDRLRRLKHGLAGDKGVGGGAGGKGVGAGVGAAVGAPSGAGVGGVESGKVLGEAVRGGVLGFLSDYPVALHGVYMERQEAFLKACRLKIQLNGLGREQEAAALDLERAIYGLFQRMDELELELKHWRAHRQLLEKGEAQGQELEGVALLVRRNTLRSNIVSRSKSIEKWKQMAAEMKQSGGSVPFSLQEKIYKKEEQLSALRVLLGALDERIRTSVSPAGM